ncbi:glycosyl transferase [Vibrio rotiferianus]|uniref:Glycosyltransferase n=1 Tax=Vibrio rotiferianus TaxID=190895 RepID=A0ABX3D4W7_9VIBR|nr:glycosyl transferase [Vibrio rotiferianus]OHY90044.1 glycosyltransferase [Vibrio rotiferianus]
MKVVICHTNKGGAYRVAKFYAECLESELLINPSPIQIFKLCFNKKIDTVFFHNIALAFKYCLIFRLFNHNVKVFNVEHFVMSQMLKHEVKTKLRRFYFFLRLYITKVFNVKTICLDDYSKKNRKKFIKGDSIVIYNPLLNGVSQCEEMAKGSNHNYDLVWSGGLSYQKKWPEVLDVLAKLAKSGKKVAIASYDQPNERDRLAIETANIDFFYSHSDWTSLSENYLFSSNYEGYPLVLIEAMQANMNIIAWCNKACSYQILKYYRNFKYYPGKLSLENLDLSSLNFSTTSGKTFPNVDILKRHNLEEVARRINEVVDKS